MMHFKNIIIIASLIFITSCASLFVKEPQLKKHIIIESKNYIYIPPEYVKKKLNDIGKINLIIKEKPNKIYLIKLKDNSYKEIKDRKQATVVVFELEDFKLLTRIISQRKYYFELLNIYAEDRILMNEEYNYENQLCKNEISYKDLNLKLKNLQIEEINIQLYNSKEIVRYYKDIEKVERFLLPFKLGTAMGLGIYGILR